MDSKHMALAAAALVVAALVLIVLFERRKKAHKKPQKMTVVYGKSFIDLPHAPISQYYRQYPVPAFTFDPTEVAGASFAYSMP